MYLRFDLGISAFCYELMTHLNIEKIVLNGMENIQINHISNDTFFKSSSELVLLR